jgi:hypothetical protein
MDFIACSLRNFQVSDYAGPIEINSNGKTIFYLLFQEPEILNIPRSFNYSIRFGIEEAHRVTSNFVCYSQHEPSIVSIEKRRTIVNNRYVASQTFSNALWFIKDNAVTPYFSTISSNTQIEPEFLRRNVYYTNSEAGYSDVFFNNTEIEEAMTWYDLLDQFNHKIQRTKVDQSKSLTNMSSYISFETPSFQRAFYYLDVARKTDFLPAKIASYISILESLLAVKGENTHKVAERTAALIEKDVEERYKTFRDMVSIYNIRSDYIHGSEIKHSTQELLPQTSKKLDSIVRRVLIEMFKNHPELNYRNKKDKKNPINKNFEEVNEWFNQLVLSKE